MMMALPLPGVDSISIAPPSFVDVASDDIHTHAAAGDIADLPSGGESRLEISGRRYPCR